MTMPLEPSIEESALHLSREGCNREWGSPSDQSSIANLRLLAISSKVAWTEISVG